MAKKYEVLVGLSYPATKGDLKRAQQGEPFTMKRAEPGDVVTDIPATSIPWLIEQELIREEVTNDET